MAKASTVRDRFDHLTVLLFACMMLSMSVGCIHPLAWGALRGTLFLAAVLAGVHLLRYARPSWRPVRTSVFDRVFLLAAVLLLSASVAGLNPILSLLVSAVVLLGVAVLQALREAFNRGDVGWRSAVGFSAILAGGCVLAVGMRFAGHVAGFSGSYLPWYSLAPLDGVPGRAFDRVFSFFLVASLPLTVAGAVHARGWTRRCAALGVLVVVTGMALAFSRAAWIAVGVEALAAMLVYRRSRRWALYFLAVGCISAMTVPAVRDRLLSIFDPAKGSNGDRLALLAVGMDLMARSPMLGYGPGAFGTACHLSGVSAIGATHDVPHNLLLRIGVECGLPALCFFMTVVYMLVSRLAERAREGGARSAFCAAGVASIAGAIVFGLFHM